MHLSSLSVSFLTSPPLGACMMVSGHINSPCVSRSPFRHGCWNDSSFSICSLGFPLLYFHEGAVLDQSFPQGTGPRPSPKGPGSGINLTMGENRIQLETTSRANLKGSKNHNMGVGTGPELQWSFLPHHIFFVNFTLPSAPRGNHVAHGPGHQ